MQKIEERWQHLVDDVGLANATRLIMTENPGRGDSVAELDSLWQGMTVFQIYETILAEKSACTQIAEPWSEIRAGANANIFLPPPCEVPRVVTCNSWLRL
jgi:hypothetical protein